MKRGGLFFFLTDHRELDNETAFDYLSKANIDIENSKMELQGLIRQSKIKLKIEKGKRFRKEYYKLLDESKSNVFNIENEMPELALAFRKLKESYESSSDSPGTEDSIDDIEKLKILEYLRKRKK